MSEMRLVFQKIGRAKYLSHLDVMRTFNRAFIRAGFPLKFSQGFNPHPRLSVAHPLPVGVEGYAELLDFDTKDEMSPEAANGIASAKALERLAAALPEGIKAVSLYTPDKPVKGIAFADYTLEFLYDNGVPSGVPEVFEAENIPVMKKTKGGVSEVNLRSSFVNISVAEQSERSITLAARIDAHNAPINPRYFADALASAGMAPDFARYARRNFVWADEA